MALWRRLADGMKAFRMAFAGGSAAGLPAGGLLPGARVDYARLAGNLLDNSVVANCAGWIADNITEPELRVTREGPGGGPDPVPDHPLVELLRNPNPGYDGDALWQATAISYSVHGNAYWLKVRGEGGRGAVREVWWVPHWQLAPRWDSRFQFVSHYEYRAGGPPERVPPEDVVHFRYGVDPENPRLGMSRLRAVLREIVTDNEASTYWAAVLRNMGVWGAVISSGDREVEISAEEAEYITRRLASAHGGENRGRPLVLSYPVKVERAGLSPEELLPAGMRNVPEARIAGALRIPALVVGLNVGDLTRTFANYRQARRQAYEDCLMPMARRLAQAVESQLLPDMAAPSPRPGRRRERVDWDFSAVAALRDDLGEVYQRNSTGVTGGWMKVNEARARAGLPQDPDGDVYLRGREGGR